MTKQQQQKKPKKKTNKNKHSLSKGVNILLEQPVENRQYDVNMNAIGIVVVTESAITFPVPGSW